MMRAVCMINKIVMGMRSVTDALFVKLLTALSYCVGGSSIFTVFYFYCVLAISK